MDWQASIAMSLPPQVREAFSSFDEHTVYAEILSESVNNVRFGIERPPGSDSIPLLLNIADIILRSLFSNVRCSLHDISRSLIPVTCNPVKIGVFSPSKLPSAGQSSSNHTT